MDPESESMEPITISRETLFQGYTSLRPYCWLYTVTVPGEPYPFKGKGVDWARRIAKQKAAKGQKIVETWKENA